MQEPIADLYVTAILPLSVLAIVLVQISIRGFRKEEKAIGRQYAIFTASALSAILVFIFVGTTSKLRIGEFFYKILELISGGGILVAAIAAYHQICDFEENSSGGDAGIRRASVIGVCVMGIFIAAGALMHSLHEEDNVHRALCPNCSVTDEEN